MKKNDHLSNIFNEFKTPEKMSYKKFLNESDPAMYRDTPVGSLSSIFSGEESGPHSGEEMSDLEKLKKKGEQIVNAIGTSAVVTGVSTPLAAAISNGLAPLLASTDQRFQYHLKNIPSIIKEEEENDIIDPIGAAPVSSDQFPAQKPVEPSLLDKTEDYLKQKKSEFDTYAAGGKVAAERLASDLAKRNKESGIPEVPPLFDINDAKTATGLTSDLKNAGLTDKEAAEIIQQMTSGNKIDALKKAYSIANQRNPSFANNFKLTTSMGADVGENIYKKQIEPNATKAWNAIKTGVSNPGDTLQAAAGWSAENPWKAAGAAVLGIGALGAIGGYVNKIWNEHKWKSDDCEGMVDGSARAKCKAYVNSKTIRDLQNAVKNCSTKECKETIQHQLDRLIYS